MADIDKLTNVRSDLLRRFHAAIEENLQDLEGAMENGRIAPISWLTRNLLELSIWSAYCAQSEDNSKEFVLDSGRGVHDALNVPDGILSTNFSFRAAREEAIKKTQEDGFETLGESFTTVAAVAKKLGQGDTFKYWNKIFSKFAHPTALSIIQSNA